MMIFQEEKNSEKSKRQFPKIIIGKRNLTENWKEITIYSIHPNDMSTKQARLTYFDHTWGRALAIRIAFRVAKQNVEDIRVKFPQLVEQRGPSGQSREVPLGFLPTIELESGQISSQSQSIARYAGRVAGMYPNEDFEKSLLVDEVMESALEMMMGKPTEDSMKKYLKFLSDKLGNNTYLLGDEVVSIADLIIFQCMFNIQDDRVEGIDFHQMFRKYPKLLKLFHSVSNLPYVQEELNEDRHRYNNNGGKVI